MSLSFNLARPKCIPGVGKVLALILLYKRHDVQRFNSAGQFLSYARKKAGNAQMR
jgi:hypothetical protein